jgi:hypothetical protein
MFNRIRTFIKNQKIFCLFSSFFAIYLGAFIINHFVNYFFIDLLQMIGGLFFMIFGTGLSIVLILQKIFKKYFSLWEFISLALLSILIVPPIILTAEFFLLKKVYDWYPILNSLILWIAAGFLLCFDKISLPKITFRPAEILKHPLSIVFFLGFIFTLFQVLAYPALPDLDPYKWLTKYSYQFSNQLLDYKERPFFGAFTYIAIESMGISILDFFKYFLPFFILLTLFPAWMVAKTLFENKKRWLFILFTFTSPVVLLYSETAMPQTPFIILSYFFILFLLYSSEKKDEFFAYIAGIIAFLAFFYHQTAIILFIIWTFITIIAKFKIFFSDKKTFFLVTLLIITNISNFKFMHQFVLSWVSIVTSLFHAPDNLNLLYPLQYKNVDNYSMGWGSLSGVLKFYAFHAGLIVMIVLLTFGLLFIFKSDFRSFFIKKIKSDYKIMIGFIIFAVFFIIAEIMPRFPNIALLPDRAWIFIGIFSFVFVFILLQSVKKIPSWVISVFILFFIINISGTIYINNLKGYLITPAQWNSAKWIEKNLPKDRLFLSFGHKNLLPIYANSFLIKIPPELYCSSNIEEFKEIIKNCDLGLMQSYFLEKDYKSFLKDVRFLIENEEKNIVEDNRNISEKYDESLLKIEILSDKIVDLQKTAKNKVKFPVIYPPSEPPLLFSPIPIENIYNYDNLIDSSRKDNLYIYYSRVNKKNPYYDRPYAKKMQTWGIDPCPDGKFLFDLYSEKFKRIYQTKDEEVIIWKVL